MLFSFAVSRTAIRERERERESRREWKKAITSSCCHFRVTRLAKRGRREGKKERDPALCSVASVRKGSGSLCCDLQLLHHKSGGSGSSSRSEAGDCIDDAADERSGDWERNRTEIASSRLLSFWSQKSSLCCGSRSSCDVSCLSPLAVVVVVVVAAAAVASVDSCFRSLLFSDIICVAVCGATVTR